mmetsp:Transcript_731/g.1250  ORF Transcript_731/g.1250 Transcript_731/m.1250 type:complete len:229 (+) Transcript_731:135-821(+)
MLLAASKVDVLTHMAPHMVVSSTCEFCQRARVGAEKTGLLLSVHVAAAASDNSVPEQKQLRLPMIAKLAGQRSHRRLARFPGSALRLVEVASRLPALWRGLRTPSLHPSSYSSWLCPVRSHCRSEGDPRGEVVEAAEAPVLLWYRCHVKRHRQSVEHMTAAQMPSHRGASFHTNPQDQEEMPALVGKMGCVCRRSLPEEGRPWSHLSHCPQCLLPKSLSQQDLRLPPP